MGGIRFLGIQLVVAALTLGLSACTGGSTPAATSSPTPTQGSLDFETVQRLTAPRFQSDPNCVAGKWSPNSTGIDEEHRPSATTIQQYDCYDDPAKVDLAFPTRGQQSIYVEFTDEASARAFAEDEAILYKVFVDKSRVVVAGTGLDTVDMQAYLDELKSACSCGETLGS